MIINPEFKPSKMNRMTLELWKQRIDALEAAKDRKPTKKIEESH